MKIGTTALSLVLLIALAGTLENAKALTPIIEIAQTSTVATKNIINLVLFQYVDVVLKNRISYTGTLTVFDSRKQTIEISRNSDSRSLPINQIQQITFRPYITNFCKEQKCSPPPPVMRGSKITLSGIPLDAFVLLDAKKGQASVDITKIVNETKENPIPPQEPDEILYVEKIQFESTGKMTIKVMLTNHKFDSGE
ncbi:hypothetical protein IQ259_12390 [Fortiea sp. LEGE XX443]|uniref:hypothetical protein n=1 Tax=Fortiea sp. LEGE XX443 TaxID=1828611 RepID=UPI001880C709|nr:hypothetical protein [Fortiea sp. LEGE XX443]MBE9005825.1 hypothetical protein [Fortiea sp. LEGE XX443]